MRQSKGGESKPKISFQPWREDTPPPNDQPSTPVQQTMQQLSSCSSSSSPSSTSMTKQSPVSTNNVQQQSSPFPKTQYNFMPAPPPAPIPRMNFTSTGVPNNTTTMPVTSGHSGNNSMFGYTNPAAFLQASMLLQAMRPIRLPSFGFFGQQLPNIAPAFLGNMGNRTG